MPRIKRRFPGGEHLQTLRRRKAKERKKARGH